MNALVIQTAGRRAAGWGAIALFAGFLSVIFSFLGTITCAALVGMMLGAINYSRWFSVSVSLVFPAAIFGLFRAAKVNLTAQQVLLVAGLCFGTFWVTYLVSAFVFFCEQKGRKPSECSGPARQPGNSAPAGQGATGNHTSAAGLPKVAVPSGDAWLEQLQGEWLCEVSHARGAVPRRVIQIKEARLELRAIDSSGRATVLAQGDLNLQAPRPLQPAAALASASDAADTMFSI